VYLVRKGGREFVVEILRTPDGKAFVSVHFTLGGAYPLGEEVKEWDLLELSSFKEVKDTPTDYESLPPDVRRAISELFR